MNDKISVIVPIYNVEKYLPKCIDSIIGQTYKNLEIILVNDGSPDNSRAICEEYASKDSRIKVVNKENGGLSDARNAGLDVATGVYVSFIDSDDYIHEEYCGNLMSLMVKHDAEVAQCEFLKVYNEGIEDSVSEQPPENENITVLSRVEALNNLFNEQYVNSVVVWNKLYKRNLFKNIRFPKGKVHEDEYTTYKVLFETKKVVCTSKQMYYYLQRSDSIMGNEFNIKRLDKLGACQEQIVFYKENKLFDLENKAKISFDNNLRISMINVLKSNLDNKNEVFHNLINFYKKNDSFHSNNLVVSFKKRIGISVFKYSPEFIVRILFSLFYIKNKSHYQTNK